MALCFRCSAIVLRYWRDKPGREVDFVLARRRDSVDAIECKRRPDGFESAALRLFRRACPKGRNFLVTPSGDPACDTRYGNLTVRICAPANLRS